MRVFNGSAWVPFTPYVYDGAAWVPALVYIGNATGWQGWAYLTNEVSVGSNSCEYWITCPVVWDVPSTKKIITLKATGWVVQHVPIAENQAVMDVTIEGWNGAAWVELVRGRWGCSTQGETLTRSVTYSFNPENTVYTKFRFNCGGNSFTRGVTGYISNRYEVTTIPYV